MGTIIWSGGNDPKEDVVSVMKQEPVEGILETGKEEIITFRLHFHSSIDLQMPSAERSNNNTPLLSSLPHPRTLLFPSIFPLEPFFSELGKL